MTQVKLGDYVDFNKDGKSFSGVVETAPNNMGVLEVMIVDDYDNEIVMHIIQEFITYNHDGEN
jgi:hypothetical protein